MQWKISLSKIKGFLKTQGQIKTFKLQNQNQDFLRLRIWEPCKQQNQVYVVSSGYIML